MRELVENGEPEWQDLSAHVIAYLVDGERGFVESVFVNRIIETMVGIIARSVPFMAAVFSTRVVGNILSGGSMEQMIRGSIAFVAEVDDTLIVRSAEALDH
jgi:hypothetical protein